MRNTYDSFLEVVSKGWVCTGVRDPMQVVMAKLKLVKLVLKDWNKQVFGCIDLSFWILFC